MNGVGAQGAISLEGPSSALEDDQGRPPWDYDDDGEPTWRDEDADSGLSTRLRRIYEQCGDFSELTKDSVADGSSLKGKEKASDGDENGAESEGITAERLIQLRIDMQQQLTEIDNALNSGLNLLNVLLAPLDPGAVDPSTLPVPAGTMAPVTFSGAHVPPQPDSIALVEGALSLMHKQKATQDASKALKEASEQLTSQIRRSRAEWEQLVEARDAGWRLVPSGARPGAGFSLVGKGSERAAKEVGIAFTPIEAAQALRTSSLALLSSDKAEPSTSQSTPLSLVLPSRPRRRLRVRMLDVRGVEHAFCDAGPEDADVPPALDLARARDQSFEEEVFAEVKRDARSFVDRPTLITDDSVEIQDFESFPLIVFEMVPDASEAMVATSPLAKLVSAGLRLQLASLYRQRRASARQIPLAGRPVSHPPRLSILSPVLDLLQYYLRSSAVQEVLSSSAAMLRAGGVSAEVESDYFSGNKTAFVAAFADGQAKSSCGGTATLRVAEKHRIDLLLSSPSNLFVSLEHDVLGLTPRRLRAVLDVEICDRVAAEVADAARTVGVGWTVAKHSDHVIVDDSTTAIRFSVAVHADEGLSVTALRASKGSEAIQTKTFTPTQPLRQWVREVVEG